MNNTASAPDSMPILHANAHYSLIRKIGQGGMSAVYEAFDQRLKRKVALKLLHPFLAEASEYKMRFLREAQAVAALAHPNIVQIYDFSHERELYIVTELLTNGTLKEHAQKLNFLAFPELASMIIYQIALALEHAHSKNIIHRDIKPENIMLSAEGLIKLMDFGIASLSNNDENLTQAGMLLGSLAHMAPELIKGEQASFKTDIYSLSTVFFWLVTGQLPFRGDSPHALLKAIVDNPAPKIQQLSPFVSDSFAHIIERGMDKNPQHRFSSAREMAEAIEKALSTMGLKLELNKLNLILINSQEYKNFTHNMLELIKSQAAFYEKNNNLALALALKCRLEAARPDNIKITKISEIKKFNIYIFIFLALGALGLALYPKKITLLKEPKAELLLCIDKKITPEALFATRESTINQSTGPAHAYAYAHTQIQAKPEPSKNTTSLAQELDVTIWPFATIILDGLVIAEDIKQKNIKLEPGIHRLKFIHAYAATVEKIIHIKAINQPLKLAITMNKSKPAFLQVKANPEANVAIDGLFKGSSAKSLERPIIVRIPDKRHAIDSEVIIERDGYEPLLMPLKFIAGQTQTINVTLVPKALTRGDKS